MAESQRKKSGCLTALLIFLIVVYAIGAIASFVAAPFIQGYVPGYTSSYGIITGILYILNIVFLIGIWKFKKWGFYGYIAVTVVGIILGLYWGNGISSALMALIFPIILFILIRPVWTNLK